MKKFLSILILAVFATTIAILVYSVAFGQDMMLEAVIKDNKIVVYKITKTKLETTLLPNIELGISIEDAKKVCLASTGRIATTEETNKKINFWTFPITKTETIVEKEIFHDKSSGWQSQIVSEKTTSKKAWSLTVSIVCLFFYFVFLSYMAWKKKKPGAFDFWKKKKSNIGALFVSYFCLIIACLFTVANIVFSNLATEWIAAIFAIIFGVCALLSIITAQKGFFDPTRPGFHMALNGILFVIIHIVLAFISAKHNSVTEFMTMLVIMMSVSFCIGWLVYLGTRQNVSVSKEISGAGTKTKP